jgi:hypothetical protein
MNPECLRHALLRNITEITRFVNFHPRAARVSMFPISGPQGKDIRCFTVFPRKSPLRALFLFFLMTAILPAAAFADEKNNGASAVTHPEPMLRNSDTLIDRTRKQISTGVVASAKKIDAFFKEDTYQAEENTTSLRIRLDTILIEGGGTDFSINPALKLALPYTEKKMHLEIMSTADRNLDILYEKTPLALKQFDQTKKESPTATLRYFFSITDQESISMVAGTRSDDGRLAFYIGPRYRATFAHRFWSFQFIEWLRWTSDDGMESNTVFDSDLSLTKKLLLRMRLYGDWRSSKDDFYHGIRFLLFQPISSNRAMGYEWNNLLTNRPNHRIEEINFQVKYRQRFLREWIFFELAPQVAFPANRDFRATPGFLFRIEIYFGLHE